MSRSLSLAVQPHLLIGSDTSSTGFKGVRRDKSRYNARCQTSPCRHNNLGVFDTPEEGAQAYLDHFRDTHPEEMAQAHLLKHGTYKIIAEKWYDALYQHLDLDPRWELEFKEPLCSTNPVV